LNFKFNNKTVDKIKSMVEDFEILELDIDIEVNVLPKKISDSKNNIKDIKGRGDDDD